MEKEETTKLDKTFLICGVMFVLCLVMGITELVDQMEKSRLEDGKNRQARHLDWTMRYGPRFKSFGGFEIYGFEYANVPGGARITAAVGNNGDREFSKVMVQTAIYGSQGELVASPYTIINGLAVGEVKLFKIRSREAGETGTVVSVAGE